MQDTSRQCRSEEQNIYEADFAPAHISQDFLSQFQLKPRDIFNTANDFPYLPASARFVSALNQKGKSGNFKHKFAFFLFFVISLPPAFPSERVLTADAPLSPSLPVSLGRLLNQRSMLRLSDRQTDRQAVSPTEGRTDMTFGGRPAPDCPALRPRGSVAPRSAKRPRPAPIGRGLIQIDEGG